MIGPYLTLAIAVTRIVTARASFRPNLTHRMTVPTFGHVLTRNLLLQIVDNAFTCGGAGSLCGDVECRLALIVLQGGERAGIDQGDDGVEAGGGDGFEQGTLAICISRLD